MELKEEKYNLADKAMLDGNPSGMGLMIWKPDFNAIVIGNSNSAINSVSIDNALKDKIPVYKRPTGGESVVLTPNMLVLSIVNKLEKLEGSRSLFDTYNEIIINALSGLGIENLRKKGISDIAIGNKKILGSAMYRNKEKIFYHAVLNVAENPDTISRYLVHPEREPDYRKGRSHEEFVTSLQISGCKIEYPILREAIAGAFSAFFGNEIIIMLN